MTSQPGRADKGEISGVKDSALWNHRKIGYGLLCLGAFLIVITLLTYNGHNRRAESLAGVWGGIALSLAGASFLLGQPRKSKTK
jgi:hypothetical protein